MRALLLVGLIARLATASDSADGISSDVNCSSFDDDDVFTSDSCGSYDSDCCKNNCENSEWCEYFCGSGEESCADGGGAVCAIKKIGNILEVCSNISALEHAPVTRASPSLPSPKTTDSRPYSLEHGCDEHVYCEFCDGDDLCEFIFSFVSTKVLGEELAAKYAEKGNGPLAMR